MTIPVGFFAYPSNPSSAPDAITHAVTQINQGGQVDLRTWENMSVTGRLIVTEICRQIDSAELFCVDLTGVNPNVMFELGYAIAKNKRVWAILDTSRTAITKDFEQLRTLTTIGYADYNNSNDIVRKFYTEAPHDKLEQTLLNECILPNVRPNDEQRLLYLKSRVDNQGSIRIGGRIIEGTVPHTVSDPKETTIQSLTWYGAHAYSALGVICHLDSPDRDGAALNNARHGLVCGMALGFGKPLLMLCEGNHLAPMDYRDLLKNY